MSFEKQSVSGLMAQSHEISRFENLVYKTINSAYYYPDFGLDWRFFLSDEITISVGSFISYLRQEATKQGIIVEDITGKVEDFTLILHVVISGIEYEINRGIAS